MNHLTVQQLSAALDGSLSGPSLESAVHHLAHCHDCRDRQARLARNDDALRRLLAQDPHEFFLDDLERRVEALLVAIMRGLPVPPMVTSSPLQSEEDALGPAEPPLPERPELGLAGVLAHQAGFGRIGLKPAASTQAPASDPAEAQRLLDAMERGDTGDFTELTAQGLGEHAAVDGPVFDLPGWIKQGTGARPAGGEPRPREVQKVELILDRLDDRAANLPREAVDEVFRHEAGAPAAPPPAAAMPVVPVPAPVPAPAPPVVRPSATPAPAAASPYAPPPVVAAKPPVVPPLAPPEARPVAAMPPAPSAPLVTPPPATTPETSAAPATATRGPVPEFPRLRPPADGFDPIPSRPSRAQTPEVHTKVTPWKRSGAPAMAASDAPAPSPEPALAPAPAGPSLRERAEEPVHEPVPATPRRAVPNVRPTPRFAGAWLLATASVGGLLVLVLTLQFLPPADTPGASAWRGFQMPDVQFAPGDSADTIEPRPTGPAVRSATTPLPVESPVPDVGDPFLATPADSASALRDSLTAPADTLGREPGR